ncbi:MAG: DUF262 domain-containing protein [Pseudomonadota bacterium]
MNDITTFTSDKERLEEILKAVAQGKIQLPEFQRGWVWDDVHIRSLLASVSLSYPIGAMMVLENGNPDVRFKPRPIEGVELDGELEPERFVLDGQQRLTSLYQTLSYGKVVKTRDVRKRDIKRWYYIDMCKALDLNLDREDAIVSLPENKIIRNFRNEILEDYSTKEAEYKCHLFPVWQVFDSAGWRREFNKFWQHSEEKINLFDEFERRIIERFKQYLVPVIKLFKNTPKVAVCQVFEKVNTGGVSLTVFELVTASFAADGYNLREDWEGKRNIRGQKISKGRKDRIHNQPQHKVLRAVGADELLQSITLLTTYERKQNDPEAAVSCKRNDILKLTLGEYQKWCDQATQGFIKAGKVLFQQKLFTSRDLPYSTQVVPLSTILTILGDKADIDTGREKLIRWYWCGVFGELYGGAIETRFSKDLVDVLGWIGGGGEPKTVEDCNFSPTRLYTLRTRNSAAYKGLYAILMRDGGLDFRTGEAIDVQAYFEDSIDVHHIFPRKWCQKENIEARYYDSIINKTPLSYKTNRIIGGNAPSVYLKRLRDDTGMTEARQDEILSSHVIDVGALKSDDFRAFFEARKEALLLRIEAATGRKIGREDQEEIALVEADDPTEDSEEEGENE